MQWINVIWTSLSVKWIKIFSTFHRRNFQRSGHSLLIQAYFTAKSVNASIHDSLRLKPMIHGPICRIRHVWYDKICGCLIVYRPLKHHPTPFDNVVGKIGRVQFSSDSIQLCRIGKPIKDYKDKNIKAHAHTEGVAFAPRKSPRARCAKSNILAQVLNQSVVYLERRVESLAVCMPQWTTENPLGGRIIVYILSPKVFASAWLCKDHMRHKNARIVLHALLRYIDTVFEK